MIKATITTVDGDKFDMTFPCWPDLWEWSARNVGRYTGINANLKQKGTIEHDNDGADRRITRSGGSH